MFRALLQRLRTALPSQCAVCHAWPSQVVCEACVARFAQPQARCRGCALPLHATQETCGACLRQPPPWDLCLAALPYAYPWSGLIARYKFTPHPGWSGALAMLMRSAPWIEPALEQADWLLPIPLSNERLRTRGFNQALELARQLAPAKTLSTALRRHRDAPAQSALTRSERLRNVRDVFSVEAHALPQIAGRRIVLIDDVMTSGATLRAAAQVLRDAGAAHITGLVLARTE